MKLLLAAVAALALLPAAFALPCVPAPDGILSWWPFDEPNGTAVEDIADGHPGITVNGPLRQVGLVGGSLDFDGGNDYVSVGDSNDWALGLRNFTIELWANFDAPGSGTVGHPGDIFIGNDQGPFTVPKWFFALGGGVLNFHINGPGIGGPLFFPQVPFSPQVGRWYHLAVRRNESNYTLFINGTPVGSALNTYSIQNANAPLTIGQAEGLGYMTGRLDEVSMYLRALSDGQIRAVFEAGSGGKCKAFEIVTPSNITLQLGEFVSLLLEARLGNPPYAWSLASGTLPAGLALLPSGILNGTPEEAGSFPILLEAIDSANQTAQKNLTLEVLAAAPPADLLIETTGTTAVPGRPSDFFIFVKNEGTTPATDAQIMAALDPDVFEILYANPLPEGNFSEATNASLMLWAVSLAPGQSRLLHYRTQIRSATPVGEPIETEICTSSEALYPIWTECFSNAVFATRLCAPCVGICGVAANFCRVPSLITFPLCLRYFVACVSCSVTTVSPTGRTCLQSVWRTAFNCVRATGASLREFACAIYRAVTRGSLDPNEKVVLADTYIALDQELPYIIRFENIGTAEAEYITLVDRLPNTLNRSSIFVTAANGTQTALQDGQTTVLLEANRTRTVNVTIGNETIIIETPYLENWSVTLRNGTLNWSLGGIFLPPNGTNQVLFTARPVQGLQNGAEIRNNATIQFEIFEPLTTNETLNIIDTVAPACAMGALPNESNENFSINWSGSDPHGEVETYTILASENGGPFEPFLNYTRLTNFTFTGRQASTYAFLCIATDTAGNTEVQEPAGEAATTVRLLGPDLLASNARVIYPAVPRAGLPVLLGYTVRNLGIYPVDGFRYLFEPDSVEEILSSPLHLEAGQASDVRVSWVWDAAGPVVPRLTVDAEGTVAEIDEGNNALDFALDVLPNANSAPVIAPIAPISVAEGEIARITILATDADLDALQYGISDQRFRNASANVFEWQTRIRDAGTYAVTVFATDGTAWASANLSVEVRQNFDDADLDGYGYSFDCNDADPSVNPRAAERCGNRIDDNCDGRIDEGCGRKKPDQFS